MEVAGETEQANEVPETCDQHVDLTASSVEPIEEIQEEDLGNVIEIDQSIHKPLGNFLSVSLKEKKMFLVNTSMST